VNFGDIRKLATSEWENLRSSPSPIIYIGAATCGRAAGALGILKTVEDLNNSLNLNASIIQVGCLGPCYAEPIAGITKPGKSQVIYNNLTPESISAIIKDYLLNDNPRPDLAFGYLGNEKIDSIPNLFDIPFFKPQVHSILRHCGIIDPENINHYIANGGYSGLAKALSLKPEEILDEIEKAGVKGRGGAGFSTAQKWRFCRKSPGDTKYIICNADEGDPGAFMNRSLLEGDPHSVLEGMLIGGYTIGAAEGYIYCRAEYPLALERLRLAINQMEKYGLVGENILGSGFNFKFKIKEGAGAFVCGEETALIASIEGKRGMPRPRPPFPAVSGLWGKPTNINNVETWANVSLIMQRGSDSYGKYGTEKSKGTKTFALVGKVERTGLIEVPLGVTIKNIIYDIGGGILKNKAFKAIQTGGPAGGCLSAGMLDLQVDYETLAKAGSIMGSGGMIVADESTCIVDLAKYFLAFTQAESCGKCTPCRAGTRQMLDILERITQGEGQPEDIAKLEKLAKTINSGALCGLGQNAPNPVLTTLRYFRDEYEDHIYNKHCKAAVCTGLVIAPCSHTCPVGINVPKYVAQIERGEYKDAVETIREKNPFPGICGRICHHPCERRCRRGEIDEPVAIRALKRFATDWYFDHIDEIPEPKPFPRTKVEKIAVIGAGPAGLTCAYFLAQMGYGVTVFESSPTAGGMLSGALPEFRLPGSLVQKEVDYIVKRGVEIRYNTPINETLTLEQLKQQGYSAFFIAAGAQNSQSLGIPGEGADIKGFYYGLNFLQDVREGKKVTIGSRVAVIGGGNVALDAARTALRLGSKEVEIYYRRSRDEMPVSEIEYDETVEEGIKINFLVSPTSLVSQNGKITGINLVKMELGELDSSGRRRPNPIKGSDFEVKIDTVIAAVGQSADTSFLSPEEEMEKTGQGRLKVNNNNLATSIPGVFAGGDFVTGPAMVIDAISAGRRAALAIDKYLNGDDSYIRLYDKKSDVVPLPGTEKQESEAIEPQQKIPVISVGQREGNFKEIELGYSEEQAVKEARRCLRCDLENI
jgi:NADH-quinone oxidoreductase subunit F